MTAHDLTVVIPVLNEAKELKALTSRVNGMPCQVVMVDGGSTDGTRESLLTAVAGHVEVISSSRGRARQMNAGAARAHTPYLLFLHADTLLPQAGPALVVDALAAGRSVWGRFDISFDVSTPLLGIVALFMNWRSALTGICTGDQGLFVTAEAFERVGGFSDMPLMEDIDISRRLKRLGKPVRLRVPVITAARRWHNRGAFRTILTMWWLRFCYWLGASPDTLAKWYGHAR